MRRLLIALLLALAPSLAHAGEPVRISNRGAVTLFANLKDARGNVTRVGTGTPAWTVEPADLAELVVAADGGSATLFPRGPGVVTVTAELRGYRDVMVVEVVE